MLQSGVHFFLLRQTVSVLVWPTVGIWWARDKINAKLVVLLAGKSIVDTIKSNYLATLFKVKSWLIAGAGRGQL
jgi:hypothetical protein